MVKLHYNPTPRDRFSPTEREIELMHKLFDDEEFERDPNIGFFTDYNIGFFNSTSLEEYDWLWLKWEKLRDHYEEEISYSLSIKKKDE